MFNEIMSPLGKQNCDYFSIVSLLFLIIFLGTLVTAILNWKNNRPLAVIIAAISPLLGYYVNRLLYSMCVGSLN